jgi:glycosyltransferase involved in cell wall biosynthesis
VQFIVEPLAANVPQVIALADWCLLPVIPGAASTSVPSKLIGYMLGAKPVIACVDVPSASEETVRKSGCGWIVDAGDREHLVRTMRTAAQLPDAQRTALGRSGRMYALDRFTRRVGARRLGAIVLEAIQFHTAAT